MFQSMLAALRHMAVGVLLGLKLQNEAGVESALEDDSGGVPSLEKASWSESSRRRLGVMILVPVAQAKSIKNAVVN